MRIVFDHQVFGLQKHGGISRYFAELARNFSTQKELRVSVIAPLHINEYLQAADIRHHTRGLRFPFDFRGNSRIVNGINRLLLPIFWNFAAADVIHETYYSAVGRGRARVRVLTIYDMIHELFPQDFPNSPGVTAAKRAAARRADHIVCISETTRQDAIRILGLPPAKTSVIYLGSSLDSRAARVDSQEILAPCILYVGVRNGYKNFRVLLEAFASSAELKRTHRLVAFGGKAFSNSERQSMDDLKVSGKVVHVTGNDGLLTAYYKAATAFVYPSKYEGFGIPPLEAMANGCPVACSNAGSILEIVGDAGAYFEPDDASMLRGLLERMMSDPEYRELLRRRGFEKVQEYSWRRCADATLRKYGELLR